MATICYEGVTIPTPIIAPCGGDYSSDECVLHLQPITEFGLLGDSSINLIIETMKTIIVSQSLRITNLETEVQTIKNRLTAAGIA
jgi:hypothetical protein